MTESPPTGARTGRDRPSLREQLRDPASRLVATFVLVPRVEIVESLAYAGFDAVIVDLEHGPIAVHELSPLAAAGQGAGAYVLVRVAELAPATVAAVLDTGVDGIVVPHIESADDARLAVRSGRFPPDGDRSLNPYVRAAAYQVRDDFLTDANESVAILVMVEGEEGFANLDAIASVPGVDGVFVGPVDLSAALGFPGSPGHPAVVEVVERILARTDELGVAAGVYCPDPSAATHWRKHGARLCALSADIAMAFDGFRHYREAVDNESGREAPR